LRGLPGFYDGLSDWHGDFADGFERTRFGAS